MRISFKRCYFANVFIYFVRDKWPVGEDDSDNLYDGDVTRVKCLSCIVTATARMMDSVHLMLNLYLNFF